MEENIFVKRLNKRDLRKILAPLNLQIADELPKAVIRGEGENGEYGILVKCKKIVEEEQPLLFPLPLENYDEGYTLVDITDFQMVELAPTWAEEDTEERTSKMMRVYLDFMQEKFGEEYEIALRNYVGKVYVNENGYNV